MNAEDLKRVLDEHRRWCESVRITGVRADLTGADLAGADLTGANLTWADLAWANLIGADLTGANLIGANLAWADLIRANLTWANLAGANLAWADLAGADLTGANLAWADLIRANLIGANLSQIKSDFFAVLDTSPNEVDGLRQALVEGRVKGSSYTGDCACLVGTIANVRQCEYTDIPNLCPESSRPAERWFLAIRQGDTPANNPVSAVTVDWIDEWRKNR